MSNEQVYLWSQISLTGTPFPYAPTPEMLTPNGVVETRKVKKYRGAEVETYHIKYDRDYVIKYLTEKAFKSLGSLDRNILNELLNDCLKLREQIISEKMKEFGN